MLPALGHNGSSRCTRTVVLYLFIEQLRIQNAASDCRVNQYLEDGVKLQRFCFNHVFLKQVASYQSKIV